MYKKLIGDISKSSVHRPGNVEDYLEKTLNYDEPVSPVDEKEHPSLFQQKFREMTAKVQAQLQKTSQSGTVTSDQVATSSNTPPPKQVGKLRRLEKVSSVKNVRKMLPGEKLNYEQMYFDLLQKYENALAENHKQQKIIKLRLENFIRKEKRNAREKAELQKKLDTITSMHLEHGEHMQKLREMKDEIRNQIKVMHGETEKKLKEKHQMYKSKLEEVKNALAMELEKERKKSFHGERELREQCRALKKELETAVEDAVKLDKKNSQLTSELKLLRRNFEAQQNDRAILLQHRTRLKRENMKLKEELEKMRIELEELRGLTARKKDTPFRYSSRTAWEHSMQSSTRELSPDKEKKYLETIERYKRLIEQERRNLRAVRAAHIAVLAERTELEIFLRQCIDDVREKIGKEVFNAEDRARVIDILLSKERVLNLLYDKTFPNKPHIHYVNPENKDINTSQEILSRLKFGSESSPFSIKERAQTAGTYESLFAKERFMSFQSPNKGVESLISTGELSFKDSVDKNEDSVLQEPLTVKELEKDES